MSGALPQSGWDPEKKVKLIFLDQQMMIFLFPLFYIDIARHSAWRLKSTLRRKDSTTTFQKVLPMLLMQTNDSNLF